VNRGHTSTCFTEFADEGVGTLALKPPGAVVSHTSAVVETMVDCARNRYTHSNTTNTNPISPARGSSEGNYVKMQEAVDNLSTWSQLNCLNISSKKTLKLYLGHWTTVVERVSQYKIHGVMVNSDLKWDDHVTDITSKAGKRLWFMKQLRRADVYSMICCTIIRQLCDLFSNMRPPVGRQVLRKNRRNTWKMFSVVLFRSLLATCRTTKHVVYVTFCR